MRTLTAEVSTANTNALTKAEALRFAELETTIQSGIRTYLEVGYALEEIRDSKLYRAEFKTFEAYCRERWDIGRNRANRLIAASQVVKDLVPMGTKPDNERQARPLTKLPKERRAEAWEKAVEASGGKPTAKDVQAAVDTVLAKPTLLGKRTPNGFKVLEESETEGETLESVAEDHAERAAIQDDATDETYLAELPQRAKLSGRSLKLFDLDALAYRKTERQRKDLASALSRVANKTRDTGEYVGRLRSPLRIHPPAKWLICGHCKGTGQDPVLTHGGNCTACKSRGYQVSS